MQCELLGVTGREQVLQLAERLTGLSGQPGRKVSYRDLMIKSQATPFTELHLVQHTLDDQAVTNDRCFAVPMPTVGKILLSDLIMFNSLFFTLITLQLGGVS